MQTQVSNVEKRRCLESAVYYLIEKERFFGAMLQCLTINYSQQVPTAGITFNTKLSQYEIYLNPQYFCGLTLNERIAILHHEILHFTNKHLFRLPFLNVEQKERTLYNIAGDMAINQYIQNLPKGGVDVKEWKTDKGVDFPVLKSMEEYYELIKNNPKEQEKQMKGYKEFDVHDWKSLSEEEKEKMIEEAKKLVKRTIEKTGFSHNKVPDSIADLLETLDGMQSKLNYKNILRNVIKKTVCCVDRTGTWNRPNKRYASYAPGSKVANMPNLSVYIDTSGSISHTEMNMFLSIMNGFLKAGTRQCYMGLWHTQLYYKKKYKMGKPLDSSVLQSGGTSVCGVLEDIKKSNPNLAVILTDGYYDNSDVKVAGEVLWVISSGGNKDHPLKRIGKTIMLDGLK